MGNEGQARLPDFVIAGAAKSGTTSLAKWLRAHDGVYLAEKEGDFFNIDSNWERGVDWYQQLFVDATEGQVVGEKTPDYMFDPTARARMGATLPDAKVIVILREPVARAYSHYQHWHRVLRDDRSFAEAVRDELSGHDSQAHDYVAHGQYVEQVEALNATHGCERVKVLLFDDLVDAPERSFRDVCAFLGVDEGAVPEVVGARFNEGFTTRAPRAASALSRYRLWRRIPNAVSSRLWRSMFHEGYAPMDDKVRSELERHYAPYNEALARHLDRKLPW